MLRGATIGSRAARSLDGSTGGIVAGVFERTVHVALGDEIICIAARGIENGPINLVVSPPHLTEWSASVVVGDIAQVEGNRLRFGRIEIDRSDAKIWRPEPWSPLAGHHRLREALDRVMSIVRNEAPGEGLVRLAVRGQFAGDVSPRDAIARIAVPRLTSLRVWLHDALTRPVPPPFPAEALGLLGLGPGLTPSGDDLLCGVLLGFHALRRPHLARELSAAVLPAAKLATTPLSCTFLAAAADGEGGEALHGFVSALVSANLKLLPDAVAELGRVGHSSGWDALAGVVLAVRAFAADLPAQQTQSP